MTRGSGARWLHVVLAVLWLALVALDWPDLSSGPIDDRLQTAVPLLFAGWTTLSVALVPDLSDAVAMRRVMRVQIIVNVVLLALVAAWARWETVTDGRDLKVLAAPVLVALVLVATVAQYRSADRTAAKAREREDVALHH